MEPKYPTEVGYIDDHRVHPGCTEPYAVGKMSECLAKTTTARASPDVTVRDHRAIQGGPFLTQAGLHRRCLGARQIVGRVQSPAAAPRWLQAGGIVDDVHPAQRDARAPLRLDRLVVGDHKLHEVLAVDEA